VVGSNTTSYAWDFENRLTSVTLPGSGGTVSFKYDPFGRRTYKSSSSGTSVFAYDGDNLVEEANASGAVVARYSQGLNIDEPLAMLRSAATSYYHADGLGSISSLSNAAGSIANTYTYDSFGKLTASTGSLVNSFQYTARESDAETGLYYYRARYYNPTLQRFISEDPIGLNGGDVNFYPYVGNSPTNLADPFGLSGMAGRNCGNSSGGPQSPVQAKTPFPPSGNAPPPGFYSQLGGSAGWIENDVYLSAFHRGGFLDAQAYGASPAYGNYVFGVYMSAAGYSLSTTLSAANAYGALFSTYHPTSTNPMDPTYTHIPAANVANVSNGFNAERTATLCDPY